MSDQIEKSVTSVKDWFKNTFGLENMVVFSFIMAVLYLISLFITPTVRCVSGFTNSGKVEGFSDQTIDFESLKNLAAIADKLNSSGNLIVPGNIITEGNIEAKNNLLVGGEGIINKNLTINELLDVKGTSNLAGHILNKDDVIVNGALRFSLADRSVVLNPKSYEIWVHGNRIIARDPGGSNFQLTTNKT